MKSVMTYLLYSVVLAAIVSCSKKEDPEPKTCSSAWGTELEAELNAISNAATVYSNDPTPANCESFKQAYQDYIDALTPYRDCNTLTGQSRTEFEDALSQAQASVSSLCQ